MKIGLRSVMRWFNLSVTQRMRDDYRNHSQMIERDYLMMECEEDAHGGRPVMFIAVSLVAIYHCAMVVFYLSPLHVGIVALYGMGVVISIFGMFCMATTGKADKPYYISDMTYDRIMASDSKGDETT